MQTTMQIFRLIILLVLCYHVMSQSVSLPVPTRTLTPIPTPTPTPTPTSTTSPFSHPLDCPFADTSLCDPLCPYINFECEPGPGLIPPTRTFAQSDICEPLFVAEYTRTCSFISNNGEIFAFKCPNGYGQQTALLCFPPNIPLTADYCFCNNSAYPRYGVSGVPDIKFIGNASNVTEDEGILTVCAAVGQLPETNPSVNVTISTNDQAGTAIGGIDYENIFQEFFNLESHETRCVNISILKDAVDEVEEYFLLNVDLAYAPFDILVDTYNITITDSDIIGLGFEQEVITVSETAGSVTVCVSTNVTLNGTRTASGVLHTVDVTAQADVDYLAVNVPLRFLINGDNHVCVAIAILPDIVVQDEYFDVFLVRLNSTDTPLFTPQVVVIIMDQDQLYPFGGGVGDEELTPGIVTTPGTSSPPLTLSPKFRFFSSDEDIIFVNTNGALSFNRTFQISFPQPFGFSSFRLISPYWENFETQRFGRVYYRNTADPALLRRAQYLLQDIFPSARNFFPNYLFIATWDSIPEFGIAGNPDLTNTFQAVLATDGEKSFVFFTYVSILWGEGAMGFDAGDGRRSLSLPGSRTTAALDVEEGSNVDVEGLYTYRVDLPEIISPGDCGGQDGVIRLFNGSSAAEGVVEYCDNSIWTPVCGDDWDESEAAVACRQLRFSGEGATVFHEEVGPVTPLTTDFNCTGMEDDLLECALNTSVGSGALVQVNTLQPFSTCLYLARVNCTAMQIGFEQDSYTVPEMDESVTVCVRMTTGSSTVPVTLAVLDIASAQEGIDYSTNTSIVEFVFEGAPQQVCVKINIIDDDLVEQTESFLLLLNTTMTSQTVSLNPRSVFVTIVDDDRVELSPTGLSSGAIAGSVVAAIVAVLLVGGIVLAVLYRRKKKREMDIRIMRIGVFSDMELAANPYFAQGGMVVHNPYIKQVPKERIIPSSSLRILNSIGQGEFGIVYKAHHVVDAMAMPTFVAVKTLKGFFDRERIAEMMRESVRMMDLHHPHVLSLTGVCLDAGPAPYIVMPFMANGSLLEYIKTEKKNLVFPDHSMQDTEQAHIARKRMADMCLQIAKGMEYLSSQNIVHRDLAARNCMIDTHFIIKVADFGLSESTYKKTYFRQKKSEAVKLPVKWLAPEALTEGVFSEKSDVWSYGVTCWEIFTGGRIPYPGVDPVSLPNLLENGLKLEKPKNAACSEELYFFMFRCWHTDPEERLSFTDLVGLMSQTLANLGDYMEVCTFGVLQEANKEAVDDDDDYNDGEDSNNDADERDGNDLIDKDKNDNSPTIEEDKL